MMMAAWRILVAWGVLVCSSFAWTGGVLAKDGGLPDQATQAAVFARLEEAIESGQMAGCVVRLVRGPQVLFEAAVGDAQVAPRRRPMRTDTLFDLASLTKPIATACSIMRLVQDGKVDVDASAAEYWPAFAAEGKDRIKVADLLLHQAGLIADNSLRDYDAGTEVAWERIANLKPLAAPGARFIYSDVGYLVLGRIVQEVSGRDLATFAETELFRPLGMTSTRFRPEEDQRVAAAATEQVEGDYLVGVVHDPRARRLGGVAGHAGLFSTAADLTTFGLAMCGEGPQSTAPQWLRAETREQMTRPRTVARGLRGYGWDVQSPYSSNRPRSFSERAFGHGGFTGTVLWVDPSDKTVFVFLSNRLHPDGKGSVNALAAEIADQLLKRKSP